MTTVEIAGKSVELEPCDPWAWYRVTGSFRSHAEMSVVLLRLCWRGPGRPKGGDTPDIIETQAEAVFRDLMARGCSAREIRRASSAAWELCWQAFGVDAKEAEEAADFTEAAAGSSENS